MTDELIDPLRRAAGERQRLIEVALPQPIPPGLGISEVKQRDDCLLLDKPGFSLKNPADMAQMAALTSTPQKARDAQRKRETVHQREDPPPDDPTGRAGRNAELDGGHAEKRKEINLL